MNMVLSRGSVPSFGREVIPELERCPFDLDLWARLETMEIDPPDATTQFRHRLRQYNKWTDDFAARVTREYRRFLYLAARAGHPVTPSDTVDQAWHLHLIYTRHYWEELCGKILGLQLHHEPSAGGTVESNKFGRQYEQTIESYKAAFGEAPPKDIWPVREPATLGALGRNLARSSWSQAERLSVWQSHSRRPTFPCSSSSRLSASSPTAMSRPLRSTRTGAAVAAARREAAVTLPRPAPAARAAAMEAVAAAVAAVVAAVEAVVAASP